MELTRTRLACPGRVAFLVLLAIAAPAAAALADAVGYAEVKDIRIQNDVLSVEHHHDWSRATEPARYKMITTNHDPFTAENTYSWLRVVDKASGKELFRAPVPALTLLWISPDSKYIVGLSSIKLWNPYQLVVFTRSGRRVFERDFTKDPSPAIQQSVTNAIWWFKDPSPAIRLVEAPDGGADLWIEDRLGTSRNFHFRTRE
jgi:hypothetical protein